MTTWWKRGWRLFSLILCLRKDGNFHGEPDPYWTIAPSVGRDKCIFVSTAESSPGVFGAEFDADVQARLA